MGEPWLGPGEASAGAPAPGRWPPHCAPARGLPVAALSSTSRGAPPAYGRSPKPIR